MVICNPSDVNSTKLWTKVNTYYRRMKQKKAQQLEAQTQAFHAKNIWLMTEPKEWQKSSKDQSIEAKNDKISRRGDIKWLSWWVLDRLAEAYDNNPKEVA